MTGCISPTRSHCVSPNDGVSFSLTEDICQCVNVNEDVDITSSLTEDVVPSVKDTTSFDIKGGIQVQYNDSS